jgi:hypothetical protein
MDQEKEALKKEYLELHKEKLELQKKLDNCKKNENAEKFEIVNLLHKYNDTKDASQILLGKFATTEGLSVKDLYKKLKLPMDS